MGRQKRGSSSSRIRSCCIFVALVLLLVAGLVALFDIDAFDAQSDTAAERNLTSTNIETESGTDLESSKESPPSPIESDKQSTTSLQTKETLPPGIDKDYESGSKSKGFDRSTAQSLRTSASAPVQDEEMHSEETKAPIPKPKPAIIPSKFPGSSVQVSKNGKISVLELPQKETEDAIRKLRESPTSHPRKAAVPRTWTPTGNRIVDHFNAKTSSEESPAQEGELSEESSPEQNDDKQKDEAPKSENHEPEIPTGQVIKGALRTAWHHKSATEQSSPGEDEADLEEEETEEDESSAKSELISEAEEERQVEEADASEDAELAGEDAELAGETEAVQEEEQTEDEAEPVEQEEVGENEDDEEEEEENVPIQGQEGRATTMEPYRPYQQLGGIRSRQLPGDLEEEEEESGHPRVSGSVTASYTYPASGDDSAKTLERETKAYLKSQQAQDQGLSPSSTTAEIRQAVQRAAGGEEVIVGEGLSEAEELAPLSEECRALLRVQDVELMPEYDESFERIKGLVLCGVPFALAKYDHEAVLIQGKDYLIRKHTGVQHSMPLRPHETSYQQLRIDVLESMKNKARNYFYAVPVPPCLQGYEAEVEGHVAGGDIDQLVTLMGSIEKQKPGYMTYSSLWTRRHYEESQLFFQGLLTGPDADRVYVFAFDSMTKPETISWAQSIVHIPADSIQNWAIHRPRVLSMAKEVAAQAAQPSIFLFNLGPISPILIHQMYLHSPNHLYIDVDGVLDENMSGKQRHHATHYTGLPHESAKDFDSKAKCTFVKWQREGDCVVPMKSIMSEPYHAGKMLSDRCYQKGAKGQPKAGRVGGYFPARARNLVKSHVLKHPERIQRALPRSVQVAHGAPFKTQG